MPFIDFAELKGRVHIEDVAQMLALDLRPHGPQLRGSCPTCRSGGDRALVVTPAKQAFYCFGGSVLLAAKRHTSGRTTSVGADHRDHVDVYISFMSFVRTSVV